MQEFDYVAAKSVGEVLSLLSADGSQARILAGGTDLLVQLREGRRKTRLVIDIKGLPEVNQLSFDPSSGLKIGAVVSCQRICWDQAIARAYPGLIDAIALIGGTQIQGRATLGGNLCNASPAADSIPALIVHNGVCAVAALQGPRTIPVEDFCFAPGQTVLKEDEFLVSIHLPAPSAGFGAAYLRFIPRNEMDIAVAGAGASVVLEEDHHTIRSARLALTAVAPRPLFVPQVGEFLAGRRVSPQVLGEAAQIAREAARPITDLRGTVAQRKHLSAVLARRALVRAIERAGGERSP
jgi:CO/xanthine dehydrogenase FAD-binding subunit